MLFVPAIYATCFLFSVVRTIEFSPCQSGVQTPTSLEISNCDKPPCLVRRGSKLNISTTFTADNDHDDITLGMTSTYMGVTQGYPGVDGTSQCGNIHSMPDNKKVGCPLQKGKMYRHEFILPLKLPMPKQLTLSVKYSLKEKATKKDFVCSEFMAATQ